jgi:Flp pilus assembly protein TadG
MKIADLLRDESGGAMVETAFALPVLITLIWGIYQFGVALQGNAGMQHSLGEGARLATLCVNPNIVTGCGRPTNAEIIARMRANRFSAGYGSYGEPTITEGAAGTRTIILNTSFTMPMDFLFFPGPNVTLSRSKTVYLAG